MRGVLAQRRYLHLRWGILVLFCIAYLAGQKELAAETAGRLALGLRQETPLAERFAPVLVFHPDERFFPCSPLFQLDSAASRLDTGSTSRDEILKVLGTPETRKENYLSLTLQEKADIATVYYRAYRVEGDRREVVIDYWLYYQWNDYRVRPGFSPFWFDGSHPNDMEHVHVVLELGPDESEASSNSIHKGPRVRSILASAHEGTAPANRYQPSGRGPQEAPHILVELGSHATAPDANQDGVYTPGLDGDSGYKMLWGTRDEGKLWSRYSPNYMEPRNGDGIVLFCNGAAGPAGNEAETGPRKPCFQYRLAHVDELHEQFSQLGLSGEELEQAFETKASWLERLSGKSNGDSDKLVIPPSINPESRPLGVKDFSKTEKGIMLGGTSLTGEPGVFLGGRYSFLNGSKYFPDLMLEADGVLTVEGKGYLSLSTLLSYPIDAITRVFGGAGLVTDTIDFRHRQWDWIVGLEVRVGHLRFSGAGRSTGAIADSGFDLRVSYFF